MRELELGQMQVDNTIVLVAFLQLNLWMERTAIQRDGNNFIMIFIGYRYVKKRNDSLTVKSEI